MVLTYVHRFVNEVEVCCVCYTTKNLWHPLCCFQYAHVGLFTQWSHILSLSLSLSALLSTSVGDHGSPSGPIFCQSQDVNVLQGAISLGDVAQYTAFVDETLVLLSSSSHYAWKLFVFAYKLLTRLQWQPCFTHTHLCRYVLILCNPSDRNSWTPPRTCPGLFPCLLSSLSCLFLLALQAHHPYSCPGLGLRW